MCKPCILNLFKHIARLMKKHRVQGPPTVQLDCDNCCTLHIAEIRTTFRTQSSVQSMRRLSLFVVRKHGCNQGCKWEMGPGRKFQLMCLVVRYNIMLHSFCSLQKYQLFAALLESSKHRYSRLKTSWCIDQVIFHNKPVSRFCFHGNKSHLSASKCLQ